MSKNHQRHSDYGILRLSYMKPGLLQTLIRLAEQKISDDVESGRVVPLDNVYRSRAVFI